MKWRSFVAVLLFASMASVQAKGCKDSTTFGAWFDGETVAENPDGEDYAADSGSMVQLGCTYLHGAENRYSSNVSLGYRYQLDKSGKGRSSGWSFESSIAGHWGGFLAGLGGLVQFKGEVRDFSGTKTKIEPSFGGFVFVGFSLGRGLELQIRQHYVPLESESGDSYEGSKYGVFLHQSF